MSLKFIRLIMLPLSMLSVAACTDAENSAANDQAESRDVFGTASKGPLRNAQLAFSVPGDDGQVDPSLTVNLLANTNEDGQFQVMGIPQAATLLVKSSGGSYLDEADQAGNRQINFAQNTGLEGILPAGETEAAITVYSQALVTKIQRLSAAGNFRQTFACQQLISTQALGFNPFTTQPENPVAPNSAAPLTAQQYAMGLGGMANVINRISIDLGLAAPTDELILAVADDLSDGRIDGQINGQTVMFNGAPFPQDVNLNAEILRFRNNNAASYAGIALAVFDEELLGLATIPACAGLTPLPASPAPVVSAQPITIAEGGQIIFDNSLLSIADTDTAAENITIGLSFLNASSEILLNGLEVGEQAMTYSDVLESRITIRNIPNGLAEDVLNLTVTDGFFSTSTTVPVSINLLNDQPIAESQSLSVLENASLAITLRATDAEGDSLSYNVTTLPANGTLSGIAPNLSYTPNSNFSGSDSFSFIANDGQANSNTATVSITVVSVNSAPVADNQTVNTNEDTIVAITLSASDADSDPLSYNVTALPSNGTLSGTAPNLAYTPNSNFNGSDSFSFIANDGQVNSNTATVSINVASINDAPVANGQNVNTNENTAVPVTLTASDADGNPLSYNITTPPSNGTLSGTAPNLTYTPNSNFNGSDSFSFVANDGQVNSNTATVSITVASGNSAPIADNQSINADEDATTPITLTATDAEGDSLSYNVTTPPSNGTLSGTAPNLSYTPNSNFNGSDSFSFVANDGQVNSNTATVSINVIAINDAPVADDQSVSTNENSAVAIILTASDIDNDPLSYSVTTPPSNGTLSGTAPDLSYTPNSNFNGSDSFSFVANDSQVNSNTATVNITVVSVNNAPVAANQSETTDEDMSLSISLPATDVDNDPLTYSITALPMNGTLNNSSGSIVAGDEVTYTPDANFFGSDTFEYRVNDGTVDSNFATISITVNQVFDDVTVTDESFNAPASTQVAFGTNPGNAQTVAAMRISGSVLDNDTGDGNLTTVADGFSTTLGGLAIMNSNGTFDYFPPVGQENTQDSFDYTVQNGGGITAQGTVTINLEENYWYVDSNATTGGNGRSDQPFTTLAEAEAASNPNDYIVVFSAATAQNYGAITLKNGQRLHGQGIILTYTSNGESATILAPNSRPILGSNTTAGQAIITTADRASVTAANVTCSQDNQIGVQGNQIDLAAGGAGRFAQMRISNCPLGAIVLTDVTGEALLVNINAQDNGQASIYMTGTGETPKPNFRMLVSSVSNPEHQGVRVENAGDITIETGSITTDSTVTVTNPSTLPDNNHVGIVAIAADTFKLTGVASNRYEISGFGTDTSRAVSINAGVYLQQVASASIGFVNINDIADSDSFSTISIAGIKTDGQVEQLSVSDSEFSNITGFSGSPISGIEVTLRRNAGSIKTLQMLVTNNTFNGDGDISSGLQNAILLNPAFEQSQPGLLSERLSLTASNNQSFGASSFFNAIFFDDFPSSATQRHFMTINNNTIYDIADSAISVNLASNNQAVLLVSNNLIDGDFAGTGAENKNAMNGILVESEAPTSIDMLIQANTIRDINAYGIWSRPPFSSFSANSGNVNTQIDNNIIEYTGEIGINLTVGDLVSSRQTVRQNELLANGCGGANNYDGTANHGNGEHPYTFSDCSGNGLNLGADINSFFSDSQISINIGNASNAALGNQINCPGCFGAFYGLSTSAGLTFELGGQLGQGNSFADDNGNIANNNNLVDGIPASTSNNGVIVNDLNDGTAIISIIDPAGIALPDLNPDNVYPVNLAGGGFGSN